MLPRRRWSSWSQTEPRGARPSATTRCGARARPRWLPCVSPGRPDLDNSGMAQHDAYAAVVHELRADPAVTETKMMGMPAVKGGSKKFCGLFEGEVGNKGGRARGGELIKGGRARRFG